MSVPSPPELIGLFVVPSACRPLVPALSRSRESGFQFAIISHSFIRAGAVGALSRSRGESNLPPAKSTRMNSFPLWAPSRLLNWSANPTPSKANRRALNIGSLVHCPRCPRSSELFDLAGRFRSVLGFWPDRRPQLAGCRRGNWRTDRYSTGAARQSANCYLQLLASSCCPSGLKPSVRLLCCRGSKRFRNTVIRIWIHQHGKDMYTACPAQWSKLAIPKQVMLENTATLSASLSGRHRSLPTSGPTNSQWAISANLRLLQGNGTTRKATDSWHTPARRLRMWRPRPSNPGARRAPGTWTCPPCGRSLSSCGIISSISAGCATSSPHSPIARGGSGDAKLGLMNRISTTSAAVPFHFCNC